MGGGAPRFTADGLTGQRRFESQHLLEDHLVFDLEKSNTRLALRGKSKTKNIMPDLGPQVCDIVCGFEFDSVTISAELRCIDYNRLLT